VTRAADLMRHHDVGSLPVVDSANSKKLIGIVTDRDLVIKVVAGNRPVNSHGSRRNDVEPGELPGGEDLDRAVTLMADRRSAHAGGGFGGSADWHHRPSRRRDTAQP
jgi:CBS domain-containing protein